MGKTKIASITVQGAKISVTSFNDNDYICLTDMVKGQEDGSKLIEKWLTNKNTIEFLGIWEQMMVLKANHSEQNFRRLALNEKEQKLIE